MKKVAALFASMEKSHRPLFYAEKKVTTILFTQREKSKNPFVKVKRVSTPFFHPENSLSTSFHREKSHLPLWQTRLVNSLLPTTQMLLLTKSKKLAVFLRRLVSEVILTR